MSRTYLPATLLVPATHAVHCDGCEDTALVVCASDLPHDWGAFIEYGSVRHYCARCNEDLEAAVRLPAAFRR
ncbi:hypothetical protein [uncultured Lamprocystis sp.]|jgi:hypothetical protein|uniref:hypothetical protein n=1 Tax=uncultured Lamprocystis sp. TaxID=543132 RepID=UPI0025E896EF|nr:hypothetical protein [uncultured Lamprocystis sp.]